MANAPGTGRQCPSNDNSPKKATVSSNDGSKAPIAANKVTAMGKSHWVPPFGTSPGYRLTTMRPGGKRIPMDTMAERMRSLAS